MAYVPNDATTGNQSVFSITISSTVTPIYGITSIKHSGKTNKKVDITTLQSTGVENLLTMSDYGSFEISLNRISSDPGQIGMSGAWISKAFTTFTLVLPLAKGQTATGDTYSFTGVVDEWESFSEISSDKQITGTAKVSVSGAWTETLGS